MALHLDVLGAAFSAACGKNSHTVRAGLLGSFRLVVVHTCQAHSSGLQVFIVAVSASH